VTATIAKRRRPPLPAWASIAALEAATAALRRESERLDWELAKTQAGQAATNPKEGK